MRSNPKAKEAYLKKVNDRRQKTSESVKEKFNLAEVGDPPVFPSASFMMVRGSPDETPHERGREERTLRSSGWS